MQRIEAFLSEGEVPDWASTLGRDLSYNSQPTEAIGFSEATFEWEEPQEDLSPSRFRLGPLDFMFPTGKLTLVSGPTGSGKTALLSALMGGNGSVFLSALLRLCGFLQRCTASLAPFISIKLSIELLTVARIHVRLIDFIHVVGP